jgi:hypothetical protein
MNFESFTSDNIESQNEILKQEFEKSLETITHIAITPDNIDSFANESLENLIALTESVVEAYEAQTPHTTDGKELEDLAFSHFNTLSVEETIEHVIEIQESLNDIDTYILQNFPLLYKDIMPPGEQEIPDSGDVPMQRESIDRPKLKTILFILAQNNIEFAELETSQGTVSKEQRREQPYFNITIPSLARSVYVSDEYGNATYIFDTNRVTEEGFDPEDLSDLTKEEKNEYIKEYPGIGIRRVHSKHFAMNVEHNLFDDIPEAKESTEEESKRENEYKPLIEPQSNEDVEVVPEGWMTNNGLAKEIGISNGPVKKQAEKYRFHNPDLFKKYRSSNSRIREYYSPELVGKITIELTKYDDAPVGWVTNRGLARELKISAGKSIKEVEKYRLIYPDWFKDYLDKSRRKQEHYSPYLIEMLRTEFEEHEEAPDGWLVNKTLAENLGYSKEKIKNLSTKFRQSNPEWFVLYKTSRGTVYEHYAPDLIKKIKEELDKYKEAPEGWMPVGRICKEYKYNTSTVKHKAKKYRTTNSEWFEVYFDKMGRSTEHYSPELIVKIKEELDKYKEAPEGWVTNGGLADEYLISDGTVKKIAKKYRTTNSEWFEVYFDKMGRSTEHYSPELIVKIKEELDKYKEAPEGWVVSGFLSAKHAIGAYAIRKIADKYRKNNPNYFGLFKNTQNRVFEHYSPELVEKIEEEISRYEVLKDGWVANKSLADMFGVNEQTTKKEAEKFRNTYPQWFKFFRNNHNQIFEYYSPELIKEVEKKLKKYDRVPEGWVTNREISIHIGVSETVAKRIAQAYKETKPGWFRLFKNTQNRVFEHYSPELVEKIEEEIGRYEAVPVGWMNHLQTAHHLGYSAKTIDKRSDLYRSSMPEWFKKYRGQKTQVWEYFSPELITQLKKDFGKE